MAQDEKQDASNPPLWSCGEPDSFANMTMNVRLPSFANYFFLHYQIYMYNRYILFRLVLRKEMVREIIKSNQDRYSQSILDDLEKLAVAMANNEEIKPPQKQNDAFDDYWDKVWRQYFEHKTWQTVPFYPIEAHLFRVILETVKFNDANSKYYRLDPFERSKLRELIRIDVYKQLSQTLSILHSNNEDNANKDTLTLKDKLYFAITCCMWSNKMDLNFKPGKSEQLHNVHTDENDKLLLADDRDKIVAFFMQKQSEKQTKDKSVSMVCDNSGAEFLNDLMCCDFLLKYGFAERVHLHVKLYPTYVSDVTLLDVDRHLSHLYVQSVNDQLLHAFYLRLSGYLKQKQLVVVDDHFWNSAACFDEIPQHLNDEYFKNDYMVFFKGDANYRRLVLAKMWNPSIPFEQVIGSYFVSNAITLRTMKSDCAIGIDAKIVQQVEKEDAHWRHNGKRGVIQCYIKT